jgi:hypothetical protein
VARPAKKPVRRANGTNLDALAGIVPESDGVRASLPDKADTVRYIETLPKRGYRFIGEVEREEPKEESLDPSPVAVVADERSEVSAAGQGKAAAAMAMDCGPCRYYVGPLNSNGHRGTAKSVRWWRSLALRHSQTVVKL